MPCPFNVSYCGKGARVCRPCIEAREAAEKRSGGASSASSSTASSSSSSSSSSAAAAASGSASSSSAAVSVASSARREARFEGHGTWQQADGVFRVPDGVEIHFFCDHGSMVSGNISRRAAVRARYHAGQMCENYRLWPLYGAMTLNCSRAVRFPQEALRGLSIDVVIGVHAVGIELAYMVDCLAQQGVPVTISWYACREVVDGEAPNAMRSIIPTGLSMALFHNLWHDAATGERLSQASREGSFPTYLDGSRVVMLLPNEAGALLSGCFDWNMVRRIGAGVMPGAPSPSAAAAPAAAAALISCRLTISDDIYTLENSSAIRASLNRSPQDLRLQFGGRAVSGVHWAWESASVLRIDAPANVHALAAATGGVGTVSFAGFVLNVSAVN